MRAAVFEAHGAPLAVQQLADPEPAADGVVIRVGRCGICGSDLHMAEEPEFGACPGDVFGHEFAGEVVEAGRGTQRLSKGDLVSVVPLASCGHCPSCLAGEPAWCPQMRLQGGGYAEYAAVSERQCTLLPGTASLADGAIVEPLAVALHGAVIGDVRPGDRVLILGAGPIGLATAFWARRMGAARVAVQDIARHQEARAMEMGATHFLCDPEAPVAASDRALGGKADIVFDCAGVPQLVAQSVEQVRVKGRIVMLGLCTRAASFVPFRAVSKEAAILTAAFFKRQEYEAALDVLSAGAVEPRALVSQTVSLAEVPETFRALKSRTGQCKVLIAP
ncbi:zinc-dependent alcohol dehydrogenase [Mangrovicoccus algicola]|uniref:Alcohol dehydrogenase catalytic domain-containing protein n=1 Tax=Mangrovicoccus algicola TaxID=2771008 RepID=A0A8J7CKU4_9RHOB|nr:alcohol dehydrogenase catalytic domain-containing protein [Mangrovicoccus algicola]MBE3639256.1 alcohol dehydrogenase catalytic domain-containing protein [Mangrovicoccus algicola]